MIFDKSKDETKHDLRLYKSVLEVFGPSGQAVRVDWDHTDASGAAIVAELTFIAASLHTSIPSTSDTVVATQGIESTEISSTSPQTSHYAFMSSNFAKLIKRADRHEKQMKCRRRRSPSFTYLVNNLKPRESSHERMIRIAKS
ncbi:hypothetical protein HAX54_010301 [Datura stramonium]|uniref:Uncharacterized protein n=1 Tax=Datura stramonium TaxID=4076 RepID=A0ABS8WYI1_DATST|nr:hypothetical protein [Datura stramonium]